ncbi:MAG: TolC family protein [Elusimicrobiota bacterium]
MNKEDNMARAMAAVLAFAVFSPPAEAGAAALTWEAAVAEASRNNPSLAAARESVRRSEAAYRGSYNAFLPNVSASAGYSKSDADSSVQSNSYSMGLSARQSLFSGFRNKASVDGSRANLEIARCDLQAGWAQVSYDLRRSFAEMLYAQDRVTLTETIAGRRKENRRLVELRYEAGKEHKGSYLRIKAAYREAEFEAAKSARALKVAQRELATALGREDFDVLRATGSLIAPLADGDPDVDMLARATPDYRRAAARVASADASVTIARSQFIPEVSASASASRSASDWPPDSDRWSTGISLSLPLFSGGGDYYDVKGAQAARRQSRASLSDVRNGLVSRLLNAHTAYRDAVDGTEVQREFLNAAEVRAEIARSQYTSGLLTFEDWDIIENDLINNQKSLLSSLRSAALAGAAWDLAKGEGAIP